MLCKIKLKIDKTDWKVKRQKPTYIIVNGLHQMCCKKKKKTEVGISAHFLSLSSQYPLPIREYFFPVKKIAVYKVVTINTLRRYIIYSAVS